MSTVLKTILFKLRNLIDKILVKIDKPQPIQWNSYPQLFSNNYGINHIGSCSVTNYTLDGTTTDINIYDDY